MTTRQHGHQSVWQRAETIFAQCVELTPEQQNELLAVSCKNQAELRTIVEDLLRLHTQTLSIDEPPSLSVVADSMDQQSIQSWVGRRVGNYQIQKAIGQGGMGHVYLAERIDDTFNKQVAIKFVGRSRQMAQFIEQFIAERQFLASMNHPYIATLLDGGTLDDGTPYLVMEYIQGIPITAYCDQHDLSLKERLLLFIKVLQAVDYAHRQLVIHQDIKPKTACPNCWILALQVSVGAMMMKRMDPIVICLQIMPVRNRFVVSVLVSPVISIRWVCCCINC